MIDFLILQNLFQVHVYKESTWTNIVSLQKQNRASNEQ